MSIENIVEWFEKAVPQPTEKNFNTQLGVHIEELVEMLECLTGVDLESDDTLAGYTSIIRNLSRALKEGVIKVTLHKGERIDFLDSLCDQVVTATGLAVYQKMDMYPALKEVARSNTSKFGEDGLPLFDDNKKIIKGPNYVKPNLSQFV